MWKLLHIIRSHLFISAVYFALGDIKKIFLQFMSDSILSRSSVRSFMISGLIFRSLTHFEFIFLFGMRKYSNLIVLYYLFSIVYSHLLCYRYFWPRCMGWFLGSLFCSIDLCVHFCARTMLFDYCSFAGQSELWKGDSLISLFFLNPQDSFGNSEYFVIPYAFLGYFL